MKSREVYKRYLLKINKNDTNEGINILPSLFVLMFNSEAQRWLGQKLTDDGDNIKLDHLDTLLETDVELSEIKAGIGWKEYQLPKDFYRHSSSYAIASKGNCTGVTVYYFEKKALGLSAILADDFNKAHFDYEEGPMIITQNRIKAYTGDFEIEKFLASYYRVPVAIDIAGYKHIDGTPSTDVDCELDDHSVDEVLNRLTLEIVREYENSEAFQYAKERIATEP